MAKPGNEPRWSGCRVGSLISSLPVKKASRMSSVGPTVGCSQGQNQSYREFRSWHGPAELSQIWARGLGLRISTSTQGHPQGPPIDDDWQVLEGKSWWRKQLGGHKASLPSIWDMGAWVKKGSAWTVHYPWHRPGRVMLTIIYRGRLMWQTVLRTLIILTDLIYIILLWGRGFYLSFGVKNGNTKKFNNRGKITQPLTGKWRFFFFFLNYF